MVAQSHTYLVSLLVIGQAPRTGTSMSFRVDLNCSIFYIYTYAWHPTNEMVERWRVLERYYKHKTSKCTIEGVIAQCGEMSSVNFITDEFKLLIIGNKGTMAGFLHQLTPDLMISRLLVRA